MKTDSTPSTTAAAEKAAADALPVVVFNELGHEQGRCTLAEFVADNADAFPFGILHRISRNIAERIKCLGHDTIDCGAGGVFTIRPESTESLWRVESQVPGRVGPAFVDWYEGHTMEQVIQTAKEDAFRYGLPESATFTARLATPEEIKAFREDT